MRVDVEVIIYGLVNGMTFVLMAVGFSFVYGISRLPNFAHGALYVVTGFITWSFINKAGLPYWLSVSLSILIVSLIGMAIYQFLLIRVRGMPISEIIVSFAVALGILEGLRLQGFGGFKGFIGPGYVLPPMVDRVVVTDWLTIDWQRLLIIAAGLLILGLMWLFTHYHKLGLALRAMAQHERAALMLGINSDRMANVALAIGSALSGFAAVVIMPLGNINCESGYSVLTHAIAVCVIGGLGSWMGTVIAALTLGMATTVMSALGGTMWNNVLVFGLIILILIARPSGLFGQQKELEERV
ncbi:MAG: branched-chain amino acid ABC transporter permease [Desulfobacterales bacterium]|nr:MAG: branched-chain amino acid ABC transporter permease [Desulfobacterales bacterium]